MQKGLDLIREHKAGPYFASKYIKFMCEVSDWTIKYIFYFSIEEINIFKYEK